MLALYPSNKLEHLSFLLGTLLKQRSSSVLAPTTILVESPGMQHWLNMELARQQGIAMNLSFPLPVRFMWDTARTILGAEKVPRQSPYRREVLMWRIDALLADAQFISLDEMTPVKGYWAHIDSDAEQTAQRLQLATVMADVFEQYLLYRPDWLSGWERGELQAPDNTMERWQAALWRALTASCPLHPAALHNEAIEALKTGNSADLLPERVIVFAINTMAPQLVAFFDALAEHIDIHIFHLNPSVNYWGDVKSNSDQARALREGAITQWMKEEQSNPFLGNLGKQGRDLFNLLTQLDTFEVSAFDTEKPDERSEDFRLLQQIQYDVLQARAPQVQKHDSQPEQHTSDDSVIVASAHSALREVQALHDRLLRWMQDDPSLTPSDIVVMCPAIEEYAPLIDAVFHRVGTPRPADSTPPRIPCSIADRAPLDAEPMVAAFINLLTLPDSRFRVVDIMDLLRLDAMRAKFDLLEEDTEIITYWLQQAHVHWGLDGEHKATVTDGAATSETYSWWWGLKRLLIGMAYEDKPVISNNLLTLPDVEGQQALALGKLMQIVDMLGEHARLLNTRRTAEDWHQYLLLLRDSCFSPLPEQHQTWESLGKASADLAAQCAEAGYDNMLSLRQVREVLMKRFSSPDAGNHFMTGQVTFCSMLPMRSIPFSVVAVLGLNDGEFPRQSTPASVDLMASQPRKLGDRSRRLEDRYLFLEAMLSARKHLYLSYQGNSAQDNSERQPSLVLAEFLDVMARGYCRAVDSIIQQVPLHPFSAANFTSSQPGFEAGWCKLANAIQSPAEMHDATLTMLEDAKPQDEVTPSDIARSLANPLRYFANQQLGVYLDPSVPALENREPFAQNNLTRYQVIEAVSDVLVDDAIMQDILSRTRLHGDMPDTPLTDAVLTQWQEAGVALTNAIGLRDTDPAQVRWQGEHITIKAQAWQGGGELKWRHAGSQHSQRKCEQLITSLCFAAAGIALPLEVYYIKWSGGEFQVRKTVYAATDSDVAQQLLSDLEALYVRLHLQPVPAFIEAGLQMVKKAKGEPVETFIHSEVGEQAFKNLLSSASPFSAELDEDPYVHWFYPRGLSVDEIPFTQLEPLCLAIENNSRDSKV
ncbi:exodeoxyribonuclease V subunit gamma [Alteromonas sp. H39]|uniref:exodeoxyribonuclease V subunit gamma n=1 Tax=Alteromonas sp. H39 TaxID=3389876 RepID=UPI0039E1698F